MSTFRRWVKYLFTFSMTACNSCCSFWSCFSASCKRSFSSLISSFWLCTTAGGLIGGVKIFMGDEMVTGWIGELDTGAAVDEEMIVTYSGCLLCQ